MKKLFTITAVLTVVSAAHGAPPETVHFQSLDGKTMLVAYLFHPEPGTGREGAGYRHASRTRRPLLISRQGRLRCKHAFETT